MILTLVVLREVVEEPDPDDPEFGTKSGVQYRVLSLKEGDLNKYAMRVYREVKKEDGSGGDWVMDKEVFPSFAAWDLTSFRSALSGRILWRQSLRGRRSKIWLT